MMHKLRESFGLCGIALTGYGTAEDIAQARNAGFLAHVVKPVRIAELRKLLRSMN